MLQSFFQSKPGCRKNNWNGNEILPLSSRSFAINSRKAFRQATDDLIINRPPAFGYFVNADTRITSLRCGGATRRDSVLHALEHLLGAGIVMPHDWVLVHDAARPGLTVALLMSLIECCADDAVGGLLALPLADTLKRADADGRGTAILSRDGLWQAQTPQMFRAGMLLEALRACPTATDEAMAMETMGYAPQLVRGAWRNLKLTYRDDLELAQVWLETNR